MADTLTIQPITSTRWVHIDLDGPTCRARMEIIDRIGAIDRDKHALSAILAVLPTQENRTGQVIQ